MEDSDPFVVAVLVTHTVSFGIGAFGSLFVLGCVLFATPKNIREYALMVGVEAVADFIVSVTMFLLQPRIIPKNQMFAFLVYGPARHFSPYTCLVLFSFLTYALFYGIALFPFTFAFRYYVIRRNNPSVRQVLSLCIGIGIFCLAIPIICLTSETDTGIVVNFMLENAPYVRVTEDYALIGIDAGAHPQFFLIVAAIVIPSIPLYCGVLFLRSKIIGHVDTSTLHEKTKHAHRRLIHALTVHALLPVFFIFPPTILYVLYHLEVVHFREMEFIIFSSYAFVSVFNPYINIVFIRAYWDQAKRFLKLSCFSKTPSASSVLASAP